jgi:hypothetical protein
LEREINEGAMLLELEQNRGTGRGVGMRMKKMECMTCGTH